MELNTNVKTGDLSIKTAEETNTLTSKLPNKDLVTRVSEVKPEPKKIDTEETASVATSENKKFDTKELEAKIEAIQDPELKEQIISLRKSLISGENKKYQEIADLRKDLERKIDDLKSGQSNWTPNRIQQLLTDPEFVKAAKEVAGDVSSSEEFMTDEEKARQSELSQLKQKMAYLEQQNFLAQKVQQDILLKSKYANYDPQALDIITSEVLERKRQVTREDVFKAMDYEDAVTRAYQLGKVDALQENNEKVNNLSVASGINVLSDRTTPALEKGESDRQYFNRLALKRLAESKGGQLRK